MATFDAVIIAGGLGSRLQGVLGDTPKILATVAGRPFLESLFDQLKQAGVGRVVLALGHLADAVLEYLKAHPRTDMEIEPVVEPEPQGTAGAIRFARDRVLSDPVLVMNGDTFLDADLGDFLRAHEDSGAHASLLTMEVEDVGRYGALIVDGESRIIRFREKGDADGPGLINGGVYLFSASFMDAIAEGDAVSLERDILEQCPAGTLRAHIHRGAFVDIGTPESLDAAQKIIEAARLKSPKSGRRDR